MLITMFIFSGILVYTQASSPRIVNGTNVKLGERPFQAYLALRNQFCGGAVINQNYVLTAAHCVFRQKPQYVKVYVGTINRTHPIIIHKASKLIVHENYSPTGSVNDIALVKVEQPFTFSKTVAPISLMRTNETITNTSAWVSGWGGIGGPHSKPSIELKKAQIYIADQKYCADVMRDINMPIYPSNVCAFKPTLRRGHCSGDSGGPLTIKGELAGIVSWSYKDPYCASTKYPNVYTRVSSFIDWIENHALL